MLIDKFMFNYFNGIGQRDMHKSDK